MKNIIILLLLLAIGMLWGVLDIDDYDYKSTRKHPIMESNSQIDDIIQYYRLSQRVVILEAYIDSLNNRCLCLENKVNALEKAVEYETFKPKYNPNITLLPIDPYDMEFWEWLQENPAPYDNMPMIDPDRERFRRWKERRLSPEPVKTDTARTFDMIEIDSLSYVPCIIDDKDKYLQPEEIRAIRELINEQNRRLK